MRSKKLPDLLNLERDLPTTPEDIRVLRENRPKPAVDWLYEITMLSKQIPNVEEVRRRHKTFAGCEPFEL